MAKLTFSVALEKLGKTADEIALSLQNLGYVGCKKNPSHCPVAFYVYDNCNYWAGAKIHKWGVDNNDCQIMDYWFKPEIIEFIKNFDDGKYPALEDPTAIEVWGYGGR